MLRSMCGKDAGVKDYCRALTISGQKSEIGDGDRRSVARTQKSPMRTPKPHSYPEIRNDSDFLIMPASIRPISAHFPVKAWCCSGEIYPHSWQSPKLNQSRCSHRHSPSTYSQNGLRNASLPMLLEGSSRPISMSAVFDSSKRIFFCWKVLCDLENLHRKFVCELVNIQLLS